MFPLIKSGQKVYVKKVAESEINIGDVIVYRKEHLRCHRVIKKYIFNGKIVYMTKGDNNAEYDQYLVYSNDIIGIVDLDDPFDGKAI